MMALLRQRPAVIGEKIIFTPLETIKAVSWENYAGDNNNNSYHVRDKLENLSSVSFNFSIPSVQNKLTSSIALLSTSKHPERSDWRNAIRRFTYHRRIQGWWCGGGGGWGEIEEMLIFTLKPGNEFEIGWWRKVRMRKIHKNENIQKKKKKL